MLQDHHALSKYDKAETRSGMWVNSIKGTVLLIISVYPCICILI
jgi:hypothetical protein